MTHMKQDIKKLAEQWKSDHESLTIEEKKALYDSAKEFYYNSGEELITDHEYDALEKSIGYENNAYVGTRHSDTYTIRHPFIMGSLSKVQIHQEKDGSIDWKKYLSSLRGWVPSGQPNIITPKFDGCSYEVVIDNFNGKVVSISGRGDSSYGKDLKLQLSHIFNEDVICDLRDGATDVSDYFSYSTPSLIVLRGEVLVKKSVFREKYADKFANTRAFVAGMLNREEASLPEYDDLDCVIYDYRQKDSVSGEWIDIDWQHLAKCMSNRHGFFPMLPSSWLTDFTIDTAASLEHVYEYFEDVREKMDYSLDGIVIKPTMDYRKVNLTERRPADCIAIKFVPMLEPTEVTDIEWNLGKTGEYIPTIVTKPVVMDGKNISRASAFNYGYLMSKKISIGTKVVLSLAGDIIPFIYKIEDTSKFDEKNLGVTYPQDAEAEGIHLMATRVDNAFKLKHSCLALNIKGFGGANVDKFVEWMKKECEGDEFFGIEAKPIPEHILLCNPTDIDKAIGGKTGKSISDAVAKFIKDMDLKSVLLSCNFQLCGDKVATQIVNKLTGQPFDFTSMPSVAYQWTDDKESGEHKLLMKILASTGHSLSDFMLSEEEMKSAEEQKKKVADQIPVILTGEPTNYASKAEFLKCNPQYRMTGSWKEVKIVFTNSLESTTGKMKKAREKNITIKVY